LSEIEQNIDVPGRRDSQLSRKSVVGSSAPNINSKRNSKGIDTIVEAVEDAGETSSTHSDKPTEPKRDPLINPYWLDDKDLLRGNVDFLSGTEITFWNGLIAKYLFPIAADKKKEAKLQAELIDLRNQSVFAFFMINAVFVLAIFLLQLNKDILFIEWPLGVKVNMTIENPGSSEIILQKTYLQLEPIGLVFVAFFALILGVQFVAMLIHRFGTLSHLLAATPLISQESAFEVRGVHEIKKMQKLKSPDAEDKKGAKKSIDPGRRKTIHNLEKQRDKPEIATMDRQFKKKFREFEETVDKDPKLRGSRFRTTFQELQRRRSTHVQNKRNSIMEFRKSKIAQMNEPNSQPSQFGSRLAPADAASAVFQNYNRGGGIPNPAFIPDSTGNWTAGMPRPDYDVDSASSSGSNSGLRRPILAYPSRFRKRE
jgi:chitin synthase